MTATLSSSLSRCQSNGIFGDDGEVIVGVHPVDVIVAAANDRDRAIVRHRPVIDDLALG